MHLLPRTSREALGRCISFQFLSLVLSSFAAVAYAPLDRIGYAHGVPGALRLPARRKVMEKASRSSPFRCVTWAVREPAQALAGACG